MGNLIATDAPRIPGYRQLVIVGALVLALVIAAIGASIVELRHEAELRRQFDGALGTTHLIFDAQSLASRMRALQQISVQDAANHVPAQASLRAAIRAVDIDLTEWQHRTQDALARADIDDAAGALTRLSAALIAVREILGHSVEPPEPMPVAAGVPAAAPDVNLLLDPDRAYLGTVEAAQGALLATVRAGSERPLVDGHTLSEILATTVAGSGLLALAAAVTLAFLFQRAQHENRTAIGVMGELLRTDPLTGIGNRRGLAESLPVEMARAKRASTPLALAMLDLDYFKRYNSRRGHDGGDSLLRAASQNWRRQLRPTDTLVRYGGEEFTLVLPNCDTDQACLLIERLRPVVPDSQTFSAGVAVWDQVESGDDLLRRADQALMLAKKLGRNRTVVAGQEEQIALPLSSGT